MSGALLNHIANMPTCEKRPYGEPGILEGLKDKRARLSAQLDEVDSAINALEANPDVANTLELTMKALRC